MTITRDVILLYTPQQWGIVWEGVLVYRTRGILNEMFRVLKGAKAANGEKKRNSPISCLFQFSRISYQIHDVFLLTYQ